MSRSTDEYHHTCAAALRHYGEHSREGFAAEHVAEYLESLGFAAAAAALFLDEIVHAAHPELHTRAAQEMRDEIFNIFEEHELRLADGAKLLMRMCEWLTIAAGGIDEGRFLRAMRAAGVALRYGVVDGTGYAGPYAVVLASEVRDTSASTSVPLVVREVSTTRVAVYPAFARIAVNGRGGQA